MSTKEKKPYSEYSLLQAMRTAIGEQIAEFKYDCNKECATCHCTTALKYHVVHEEPTLKQLSDQFIEANAETHKQFHKNRNFKTVFKPEDSEYRNKWCAYHENNALLKLLCGDCKYASKYDNTGSSSTKSLSTKGSEKQTNDRV